MLEVRNSFLKNKFAVLFFERIRFIPTNEKLPNKTLYRLAKDLHEIKKRSEFSTLEWAINTFGEQHEN